MTNRRTTLETRFGHEATVCFPILAALYFVLSGTLGFAQEERARGGNGRGSGRGHFARPAERASFVEAARGRAKSRKAAAVGWAKARGLKVRHDDGKKLVELISVENGKPLFYSTDNVQAAISTAADLVRQTLPYSVSGSDMSVGVWDGGSVMTNHQEFGSRIINQDGSASHYHATHVGGTIGASGVVATALGMAPDVIIYSYDWYSDESEMAALAASYPGESGKIYLSNHSYGRGKTGWYSSDDSGTSGWHWPAWNTWAPTAQDPAFGQYDNTARQLDTVVYNAPYYLPFKSAGNERNDNPTHGITEIFYSTDDGTNWTGTTYNNTLHPLGDGVYDNGGYDSIASATCAKNAIMVGAVDEAISGVSRSLPDADMSSFSSWGPTDDGRIKPDIVGNGVNVYSTYNGSTTDYATSQGTSMSSPNVCGSAVLVAEYFGDRFPGGAMRASTLKGLLIHTADDLDATHDTMYTTGPDYASGWGLMDTKAAVDHVKAYADSPGNQMIVEAALSTANTSDAYTFTWNSSDPIRVTLCWTDPPGTASVGHDDTTTKLVNDLDLVITGPGPTTYSPYILDPANPANAATTGENNRDNVEQVYIASPGAGSYTVTVDYDGTLTDSEQWYSLMIDGGPATAAAAAPTIADVSPTSGVGSVQITVSGSGFLLGAQVQLTKSGESDIEATGEVVAPGTITAYVVVPGEIGLWSVVVTNPDGQSDTLTDGFRTLLAQLGPPVLDAFPAGTNTTGNYSCQWNSVLGAEEYELQEMEDGAFSLSDGAESGSGNWDMQGRWEISSYYAHTGAQSFRCSALESDTYTLTLNDSFYVSDSTALDFWVRLRYFLNDEVRFQISDDGGAGWSDLWSFEGTGAETHQNVWSNIVTDLSGYVGDTVQVRFRYENSGSYYSGDATAYTGIFVDDFVVTNASAWTTLSSSIGPSNYPVSGKGNGRYSYRVRGSDSFATPAPWSNIEPITVDTNAAPGGRVGTVILGF
jgi:hypothetical protein